MNTARPFLLLGESDERFLRERIEAGFAAWAEEWLPPGACASELAPTSEPAAARWLDADGLSLGLPPDWTAAAGALLTVQPPESSPAAELAIEVADALAQALILHLRRSFSPAPALVASGKPPPHAWFAPGAGAVSYRCELSSGAALAIALAPGFVAAALPKPVAAAKAPPVAMARAVESCPLCMQAIVGEAEIDLGELATLAPGDVILLERRVDEPLELRMAAGESVCRVYLGTAEGAKAVQLASAP